MTRVAYLGPAGTFSEDALRAAIRTAGEIEPLPMPSIHATIMAVETGAAERALVPFENAIEGAVRVTLDTLASETERVTIVGEFDHEIHQSLIARKPLELGEVAAVLSHPQPIAQCARFLRAQMPQAEVRELSSTAEAVRTVAASEESWVAIAAASAAELYDCVVIEEGIEDETGNITRFVWIAPTGAEPGSGDVWRTSLVFAELGDDRPGALIDALQEFSSRGVNLNRIESRPQRGRELGRYMFFVDLEGAITDPIVADAVSAVRGKAEWVRMLGSYPVTDVPPLDT